MVSYLCNTSKEQGCNPGILACSQPKVAVNRPHCIYSAILYSLLELRPQIICFHIMLV